MKKKARIVVDCDDVLFECNGYAVTLLNKKLGTAYTLEDIRSWGSTGTDIDKRISYFSDPEFVKNQPLMPGAKEFIKELSKRAEVLVCTSVPKQVAGIRIQRILDEFPEISPENIIIGGRKDIVQADIMLDDAPHHLVKASVEYPVIFRRPWNESMTGMPAVSNYGDFLTLVDTLTRTVNEPPSRGCPKVIAIFGPSGSGKTYLSNSLLKSGDFERVVTTTTRRIRPGETTSAYNFVSREAFQRMQEDGIFAETAVYHGEKYGTRIRDIKSILVKGRSPVIVLDINGVLSMKTLYGTDCLAVFVERDKKDCIISVLSRYPDGGKVNIEEAAARIESIDLEMKNAEFADIIVTSSEAEKIIQYVKGEK